MVLIRYVGLVAIRHLRALFPPGAAEVDILIAPVEQAVLAHPAVVVATGMVAVLVGVVIPLLRPRVKAMQVVPGLKLMAVVVAVVLAVLVEMRRLQELAVSVDLDRHHRYLDQV